MDPLLALQQRISDENITNKTLTLFRLLNEGDQAALEAQIEAYAREIQGVPQPMQDVQQFTFTVPADTLAQVFRRPNYTRPRPMIHYKKEDGKEYYNTNLECLVYEDPERVGVAARDQFLADNPGADEAALNQAYHAARQQQRIANREAENAIPEWELCQRSSKNDTLAEDKVITLADPQHRIVDWHETIQNLRALGEELGYTLNHYASAMKRFVSFYNPSYNDIIRGMNANTIARFLLSLDTPQPVIESHYRALKKMTRQVGQPLKQIMAELQTRATGYYQDEANAQQREALINKVLLTGLQNFTTGQTAQIIKASIQTQQMNNTPIRYARMLETAIQSEETIGMPSMPMKLMPDQVATSVFNTVPMNNIITLDPRIENEPILVTPLVHSPYDGLMQSAICTQPVAQRQQHIKYAPQYPYAPQHPYQAQPQAQPVQEPPGQAMMIHSPPQPPPVQQPIQQQLQAVAAALGPPRELLEDRDLNMVMHPIAQEEPAEPRDYNLRQNRGQRNDRQIQPRANVNSTHIQRSGSRSNTPEREEKRRLRNIAKLLDELKINSTSLQQQAGPPPNMVPRAREQTPPRYNQRREQSPNRRPYYQYGSDSYNRDRYSSPRYPSNDRNRYPSQDRNRYPNNRDNSRTPERDRYRRSPTPTYQKRDNQRSNYQRSYSPSYQNRSNTYQRPYSPTPNPRPQSPRPPYRPQSPRPVNRSQSPGPNYRRDRDYRNQSPRRYDQRNDRGRSPYQGRDHRQQSPRGDNKDTILRGVNCHPNYNTSQGLMCTKCNTFGKHEEYKCPTYFNWASRACYICNGGFHQSNDCLQSRQRQSTPDRMSPRPRSKN